MAKAPIVYRSTQRIQFSELDPYNHVSTGKYATYYVDHRMEGLREYVGWDLKALSTLPFMVWVRRMEIDFLRSSAGPMRSSSAPWSIPAARTCRGAP